MSKQKDSGKLKNSVATRPQIVGLMPQTIANAMPLNCPPGLEYVLGIDQLLAQQKVEIFETVTGFEANNQYFIRNSMGQDIYLASEDTDCCRSSRPFDLRIIDHT
jgi:hypothetical protein